MKRYSMVCYIIILLIFFSSCSIEYNNNSNYKNSFQKESAISAIKDVVQNKKEFLYSENGQNIYLKDFHSGNYLVINNVSQYEYTSDGEKTDYIFDKFCTIDLDGDGYPELLLEESESGEILLFHYENGIVYGFVFPFRGLSNIKKDASYEGSGGADLNYVGKVKFSKGNANFNELCLYDGFDNIYRVKGKNVSQEEANKCLKDQDEKKNVEWYMYNESNFGKYFVP